MDLINVPNIKVNDLVGIPNINENNRKQFAIDQCNKINMYLISNNKIPKHLVDKLNNFIMAYHLKLIGKLLFLKL